MRSKFSIAIFLILLSFTAYSFFQFPGFQGYENETYDRIVKNLENSELKTVRSGYAQTILETPFVLKGQIMARILDNSHAQFSQLYALFYNPFVTALSVGIFFLVVSLFCGKQKSFFISMVYAFGTMAFPYASIGMEPTAVLFVLLSVYFLFKFGRNIACYVPTNANICLFLSGLFYFLLFFSKTYYFVTGLSFVAYLYLLSPFTFYPFPTVTRCKEFFKNCFLFATPLILILPAYLLANNYAFGTYFGGQYNLGNELFGGENPVFGTYGLLLSFGKSIFIYSPTLLLSLIFLPKFYKKFPGEAVFVLVYCISLILFVSRIHWWSDETWGPRYLLSLSAIGLLPLVTLPFVSFRPNRKIQETFFWIPVFTGMTMGKKFKITVAGLVIIFSFLFQFLGVLVRYDVFPYTFYEIYEKTGYNVLASQEYQYIPQFAPYFVNYQVIKNKIFNTNDPIKYRIIYSPPMELASQKRESGIIKEISYDNSKYKAHAINFWWMNVLGVSPYWLFSGYILVFLGLAWWGLRLVFLRKPLVR